MNAIIPGYGFLSENADFARAVTAAGIAFAGPSPESIEAFGLKHTARDLATKAGVPIVPGSKGLIQNEDEAVELSKKLGFPVCILKLASNSMANIGDRSCLKPLLAVVEWDCLPVTRKKRCESHLRQLGLEGKHFSRMLECSLNDTTPLAITLRSRSSVTEMERPFILASVNAPSKGDTRR